MMSPYTAFVAVDTTRVTAGGPAANVAVPVEIPQALRRDTVLGNLTGDTIGESFGVGGLGLVGTGSGGGGRGEGTISLGSGGTIGKGAGGRLATISGSASGGGSGSGYGYGSSSGSLTVRRASVPDIIPGQAYVRGSLDKEIIRRIVRRHQQEIKYCYEQQLQKDHTLEGRMVLQLTIDENGRVIASVIAESAMDNADELGACIAQAGRRWLFPAALGGGIVIVRYPYIFQHAGSSANQETKQ